MNLKNLISLLKWSFERFFKRPLSLINALIYKENCVICAKSLSGSDFLPCAKNEIPLCKNCLKDVEILSGFAHSKIDGVEIFSACFYDGIIKQIIHKLKFQHNLSCARVLGYILYRFYLEINKNNSGLKNAFLSPENLIIVPVPTNKKNISLRGYNNVLKISENFASYLNLKVNTGVLTKIKDIKPQFELSKKDRATNIKGCFGVNLNSYKGENILIIDDIITTGYTLTEAISTLKKAGVKNIFCLTVSKALK